MNPSHPHLHPYSWFLHFLTLFLFLVTNVVVSFSNGLELYNNCGKYFSCGNVTQVGFPFWSANSRSKDCGYPELELSCENNATTKLQMMGMKYNVLDIDQNTQTLRIAREDFVQGLSLSNFINTTLDFNHFYYSLGSQNVTVFYGCPPPYGSIPSQFTCRINGINDIDGYPVLGSLGPSGCYASVVVPVSPSLAPQIGNSSLYQVISSGFEVKYKQDDGDFCADCVLSKGRCGFDISKNKTNCICPDGSVGFSQCKYIEKYTPSVMFSVFVIPSKC